MTNDTGAATALTWGVKQSFRSYVEATGGEIETLGGAGRSEDGAFTFTAEPGGDLALNDAGIPQGRAAFAGEVKFKSHGGMLNVTLADLELEIGPQGAVLTVTEGGPRPRRLEMARLDLTAVSPGEAGELVIPAALSVEGCQVLGDHYPARTALDPVRLRLGPARS
jgi:hypothetical protein